MQQLTPEELDIIREFQANQQREPGPADLAPSAPAPPPDLAKPYNDQAAKFNTQADTLDAQAKQPAPQPQGAKQHLVEAARAAMESFGRFGAPGGFYGQEEKRQKSFADENTSRIAQAKALRGEAAQQQQMGQQERQMDQTKTFQTGELANQAGQLDVSKGNLAVNKQNADREDKIAGRPVRVNETQGSVSQAVSPDTQMPIPGTEVKGPPKDPNWDYKEISNNGKLEIWALNPGTGTKDHYVADARPAADSGGADGGMQLMPGKLGPDGQPTIVRVSKKGPEGPVQIGGETLQPKPAEAPTQLKNQANAAQTTTKMAAIVRDFVTKSPELVGAASGRLNELMLKLGTDPDGFIAALEGLPRGSERDAATLSGHLAYLFLNEARATMPGRPSKDYMDFVKSRSAAMTQNPAIIQGFLKSAENNAAIIKKQAKDQNYDVDPQGAVEEWVRDANGTLRKK